MSFLLDSDIGSAHLRRPDSLFHRFMQHTGRLWNPWGQDAQPGSK